MGESKRRLAAQSNQTNIDSIQLANVASAVRRLAVAASGHLGTDCWIHSAIGQAILERLDIRANLCIGFAAWRVGPGDGDVILHYPMPGMPAQPGAVPYHVWLEVAGQLIDFSTYQLRRKASDLDAMDGGNTTVTWCPDYLLAPRKSAVSLSRVRMETAGLYAYETHPEIARQVQFAAPSLDAEDLAAAWLLYQNPEVSVIGPNDIAAADAVRK